MSSNTKLLVTCCFLIIFAGIGMLWYGLKPTPHLVEITPEATDSTSLTASNSAVVGIAGERAVVAKVVDGDTMQLDNGKTVRFIGIDTPETVDPRRPVGCFGKEASNETKSLILGKEVILQKDVSDTDKYGRLLRYVFLPLDDGQMLFVDDYLVREGFAKVLTYPPDIKFDTLFREAEKEAKEAKKGLWGRC